MDGLANGWEMSYNIHLYCGLVGALRQKVALSYWVDQPESEVIA